MQQVFDIDSVGADHRRFDVPTLRKSPAWRYLSEADRTIVELSEQHLSHRLIGRAVGLNSGTVTRRLAMIRTRVASPLAKFALDPTTALPERARDVSLQFAVAGLRPAVIARAMGLTPPEVRQSIYFAQGVLRGATRR